MTNISAGLKRPALHPPASPRRLDLVRSGAASFAFVVALFVFGAVPLTAENWPQWRGPLLNGLSAETNLPVRWSKTENIAWKLALPAWSGSTPIVWGDRIFLNVAEGGNLWLWCVDRARGAVLWKRPLGGGNTRMQKQNMSSPSPVTDGRTRVGDDRHRRPQGVRFRGQGAVVAGHPEGLRPLRPAVGLRLVAAAVRGFALRAGAARQRYRRSLVRSAHQQGDRQDDLAGRAADQRAASSRPMPTRRPRSCGTAQRVEIVVTGGDVVTGHDPDNGESCGGPTD